MAQVTLAVSATTNFGKQIDLGKAEIRWDMAGNKLDFPISQFPTLTDMPLRVKVDDGTDRIEFGMREVHWFHNGEISHATYRTRIAGDVTFWLYIHIR